LEVQGYVSIAEVTKKNLNGWLLPSDINRGSSTFVSLANEHEHLTLADGPTVFLENLGNFGYSARVSVFKQSTHA